MDKQSNLFKINAPIRRMAFKKLHKVLNIFSCALLVLVKYCRPYKFCLQNLYYH